MVINEVMAQTTIDFKGKGSKREIQWQLYLGHAGRRSLLKLVIVKWTRVGTRTNGPEVQAAMASQKAQISLIKAKVFSKDQIAEA